MVLHACGGELTDGLPLASCGHGRLLPQGRGPRMGSGKDLSRDDGVYDPSVHRTRHRPLLPPGGPLATQPAYEVEV